jgi:tRNA-2-methylthio-N6-dimethylallyladenosine synthase
VHWNLLDIHPRWVIKYSEALSKYVAEKKIISIECAIQSGSNRILELMNRHYRIEEISKILKNFRKLQPGLYLSTQLVVGFPSEGEHDFMATISAVKDMNFNEVSFYPYYDGLGSASSKMSDKIPEETIYARLEKIAGLLKKEGIICRCDEITI